MKNAFKRIIETRGWKDTRMEKVLSNIQRRLEKRLPEGVEPELTKFQETAIEADNFWRNWNDPDAPNHLMVQGATSAGKTLLSELNILDTLNHDQKAIVLVPLKAMVHERTAQFQEDMGHGLAEYGINVYGSSGDYVEHDELLIHGEHDVAIIVYEKFFAMLSQGYAKIMDECGLLIVDELAMLSLEQRGPKLEMALEIVRRKYPETRIMCLATCDCNTEKVCQWLNIEEPIISTARPVALEEHIVELNGNGMYRFIPANHEQAGEDDAPEMIEERIEIPNYKPDWKILDKERQLLLAVISKIYKETPDARVLVFAATRSKAASIAGFLTENIKKWSPDEDDFNKTMDAEFLEALKSCDHDEGQETLINELIPHGIAFHHAGISTTLRELIEEQFSKPKSNLRVIVATETLTVGVNMPFDAMIMVSNMVPRGMGDMMPLSLQEYRNYIGRAGRLGQSNRIGKTYLFVEKTKDREKYWKSYYNRDGVTSALAGVDVEILAPYYLSLLNNRLGNNHRVGTKFNLEQIKLLFNESLVGLCGNKKFNESQLQSHLYNAYLASNELSSTGALSRGASPNKEYAIEDFGTHMAPYAFSLDTCIKIFYYFYEGYKHDGLPLDLSQQDIESDRYLLDILYHVCCHKEIVESSNLIYPMGDNNVSRAFNAKGKVLEQLRKILSETDEEGKPRYALWCDVNENAPKENSDLYLLLNRSNLSDENLKLQAAMRAILLFYWTKGYSISQIREKTKFHTFTKVITGDIERVAEVASFHLDAIYKCLSTVADPESGKRTFRDTEALKEFYALHTRVKYGMPRDLVVFANKHIHGLDRRRLLDLKVEANKNGLTPTQYLYVTPSRRIPEKILTAAHQIQLRQAIERRGSVGSINTLMEILENDLAAALTSEEMDCLRAVASWSDKEGDTLPDPEDIYKYMKRIRKNPALESVEIHTDGNACKIVWRIGSSKLHIGVLSSDSVNEKILDFFEEEALAKILIVPHTLSEEQMKAVLKKHHANALLDNVYFTFALANTIRMGLDTGLALTELLADLRGIFTKGDYKHFPLPRYLGGKDNTVPQYRLIYGNNVDKRFDGMLTVSSLEAALRGSSDLQNFEVLPWGRSLTSGDYDFSECPTVILLDRSDITQSESLTQFIYKMRNQQFKNCILLLESEAAQQEWNDRESLEEYGNNCWNEQFNKIRKSIVSDTHMALQRIRDLAKTWEHAGYLIGISYAHYSSQQPEQISGCKNDVDLLQSLAEKLMHEFGEERILFDQFEPAKNLFTENRGEEKALAAYGTCRFYLILWNVWTQENKNCQAERDLILQRCQDDSNYCMFLQTGHPGDPEVPAGYFSQRLSAETVDTLLESIKVMINKLLR